MFFPCIPQQFPVYSQGCPPLRGSHAARMPEAFLVLAVDRLCLRPPWRRSPSFRPLDRSRRRHWLRNGWDDIISPVFPFMVSRDLRSSPPASSVPELILFGNVTDDKLTNLSLPQRDVPRSEPAAGRVMNRNGVLLQSTPSSTSTCIALVLTLFHR